MNDSGIKALIIEDNAEHAAVLRHLLESSRGPMFKVDMAGSVVEAGEKLGSAGADIVLLDLTLPDSAGLRTFERVAAMAGETPIVVLSGQADEAMALETVQLGAQDYLLKGHVDSSLLFRSIQYAIGRKRAQTDLKRACEELEQRVSECNSALREANEALQREVEERKRAERQSLESNRQLVEALAELRSMQREMVEQGRFKALGQMASGIAHEFNNVLTPVVGFAEHLLDHPEILGDPVRAREYVGKILDAAKSGAKAISRVRDFARAETGAPGPVSVEELVQDAVTLAEPRWRNEALAAGRTVFVAQNLEDVPCITGNGRDLRELLIQLIFNAVDAIERRGMISISARIIDGGVALIVQDDGCGMSDGERLRLLDPRQSFCPPGGGIAGYGLIHGIIERHRAKLEIESSEGAGTRVTVVFPPSKAAEPTSQLPEVKSTPSLRVLLADDEAMVREVVGMYLSEDGHTVEMAEDGSQALQKFCNGQFDLVLTDRAMPELNGDQLAIEIKRRNSRMPVVLLTGYGDAIRDEGGMPEGVDAVVAKPFTMAGLRAALAAVTEKAPGKASELAPNQV